MTEQPVPAPRSLRERQRGLARTVIVDAAAAVILDSGLHDFSMQEVADAAGVSLRTLYRYYPSRDDLLAGIGEEMQRELADRGWPPDLEGVDARSMAQLNVDSIRLISRRPDLARAWATINMAKAQRGEALRGHDVIVRDVVGRLSPHLDAQEQERLFGVVRLLAGSLSWKVMTDLGLDTEDVAEAVGWALLTLLEDIEAGGRPQWP